MSLIVARQNGSQLVIVSDTKLTYPYHEVKSQKTNPSEGVIKSVILSQNQCISFAGEIELAEAALKEIGYSANDERVIEILTRYHKLSEYKTEFLYCTGSPLLLYKFKNNEYGPVHSCYLGDKAAFEIFQSFMQGTPPKKNKGKRNKHIPKERTNQPPGIHFENFNLSITTSIVNSTLSKMMTAIDHVIEMGSVSSVGGFKVQVMYDKVFSYTHYNDIYRSHFKMNLMGPQFLGHGDAHEGAYSVHFFGGSNDGRSVGLHIRQANLGILYHRSDGGLLKPQLYKYDEIDFADNILLRFQVPVKISTQDRPTKYFKEGSECFKKRDFLKAAAFFLKGFETAKGKEKAIFLYHLGMSQWNMNDRNAAMMSFNEAIKINPTIKATISRSFSNAQRK